MDDKTFLNWIGDRLVFVYHESENVDFVLRLRKIANDLAEKDKRIKELEESRDGWKKDWRLLNAALLKAEERIKELQESHDAWEAGWRTMNTALLKAEERIKELEETIHNLRHPLSINPDEYVGDERS